MITQIATRIRKSKTGVSYSERNEKLSKDFGKRNKNRRRKDELNDSADSCRKQMSLTIQPKLKLQ